MVSRCGAIRRGTQRTVCALTSSFTGPRYPTILVVWSRKPLMCAKWASMCVASNSSVVWIFRVRTLTQAIPYPSLRTRESIFESSRDDILLKWLQCFISLVRRSCEFRRHHDVRQIAGRKRVLPVSVDEIPPVEQFSILVAFILQHYSERINYKCIMYICFPQCKGAELRTRPTGKMDSPTDTNQHCGSRRHTPKAWCPVSVHQVPVLKTILQLLKHHTVT